MYKSKALKTGVLSLSAMLFLGACDTDEDPGTSPIETQPDEMEEIDDTLVDESEGLEDLEFIVGLDSAVELFYDAVENEEVNIESIQFSGEDGQYLYEIDGWDDTSEFELYIDAETDEIVAQDSEGADEAGAAIDLEGIITPEEAMTAALEESDSGYVDAWTLEVIGDQTVYNVDVEDGEDQLVEAQTGDIIVIAE